MLTVNWNCYQLLPSFSNIYYLFHFVMIINYISSVFVINSLLLFSGNITSTRQKILIP